MPNKRDDEILDHIGRYGVTLRAVLEHLYFDGRDKACDAVLNRLVKDHKIVSSEGLPGGLNYYHLSIPEARKRRIPDHRARPKKSRALREALHVLWFCCMTKHVRRRIEGRQVQKQFGRANGLGKPHCRETVKDTLFLYRVYSPGPGSRDDYLLKIIRGDWARAEQNPAMAEWMDAGAYRFAILLESSHRRDKLLQAFRSDDIPTPHIEFVPGLGSLHRIIAEFKQAHPPAWYKTPPAWFISMKGGTK